MLNLYMENIILLNIVNFKPFLEGLKLDPANCTKY
jgi:hypothetical protein